MNETIFYFLNGFALQNLWSDVLIIFCAEHLIILISIVFVIYNLYKFFYPRTGEKSEPISKKAFQRIIVVLVAAFATWGVSHIIKDLYFSPRPFLVFDNVKLLIEHGSNDSFPSGHATFAFALTFLSFFYSRKLFYFLFVASCIIGVARVATGTHWPVDILGGLFLGLMGAVITKLIISSTRLKQFVE